jgi:hypothetical protein
VLQVNSARRIAQEFELDGRARAKPEFRVPFRCEDFAEERRMLDLDPARRSIR